ncbi:hypothetical protein MAHJHV55_51780 [Mycobacterium avium subsp. hominissuis]
MRRRPYTVILFDEIEKAHRLGQLTALVVADVARRRADQAGRRATSATTRAVS